MHPEVEPLISRTDIYYTVRRIAQKITDKHQGHKIVLLSVLKGAFVFLADLAREINLPDIEIDFLSVSSYGDGHQSSGKVKIIQDTTIDFKGKHVIIVEDIIDTGNTLSELLKIFEKRNPASLEICALLDKWEARKVEIKIDYVGRKVPLEFLVGYGLDYAQKYRNLPFIGILDPSIYSKE